MASETEAASENGGAFIRNIAEVPWREFPNHFGGALSNLVMPETAGSRHASIIGGSRCTSRWPVSRATNTRYRSRSIMCSRAKGLMEIAGKNHVVRKHDSSSCRRASNTPSRIRGWSIWCCIRSHLARDGREEAGLKRASGFEYFHRAGPVPDDAEAEAASS